MFKKKPPQETEFLIKIKSLADFYKELQMLAMEQLNKPTNDSKELPIEKIKALLRSDENGKLYATLFGSIVEQKFSPELTHRMLYFHGLICWYNSEVDRLGGATNETLTDTLKAIVKDAIYFEHSFIFLSKKEEIVTEKRKERDRDKLQKKLQKVYDANLHNLRQAYYRLKKHKIDFAVEESQHNLHLPNVVAIKQDVTDNHKTISHYILPKDFANFHLLNRTTARLPESIKNNLFKNFSNLSTGDLSILVAILNKKEGIIATAEGSANCAFLNTLASLDMAVEQPLSVEEFPEGASIKSFILKDKGFELVECLLNTKPLTKE